MIRTVAFLAIISIACASLAESPKSEPAGGAKSSEAVTVSGLEVVVKPTAASFEEGKPLTFTVTLKNTMEKDMSLGDLPLWERWQFVATDKDGKEFTWVCQGMRKILIRAELAAGKTLDVDVHLADVFSTEAAEPATPSNGKLGGKGGLIKDPAPKKEGKPLPSGEYKMVITIDRTSYKEPLWSGKIVTKPVEFKVGEATVDTGTTDSGKWIALSKDEKWYQEREGKEQVFTGTLEASVGASKPRLGGRSSPYVLGDHKVYSKKIQTLDDLVGKKVEIRGKEANFGKWGKEIWPAEIREAK